MRMYFINSFLCTLNCYSACEKEKYDIKIETETDTWKESGNSDVLLVLTIYERSG